MAKISAVAPVKRKPSGSRPEWRLATSRARVFAAAIASSFVVKTQISFSTGIPSANRLRTRRARDQQLERPRNVRPDGSKDALVIGNNPVGQFIFTDNGRFSVQVAAEIPKFGSGD